MAFGAKTIHYILEDISGDPDMENLDCTDNASIRLNSIDALRRLAEVLKPHAGIKTLRLGACEIGDEGAEVIADILANNNVIEELVLDKNLISSVGAAAIAQSLANNTGLRSLNLHQQQHRFDEDSVEQFLSMFDTNFTLTKILWRVDSRKSEQLDEMLMRNVEIQKRKD